MPKIIQVPKRKNDAQWHRLKIGNDEDQHYRDCVTQILMGINDDLSVDGLNLRLREAREDVNNAIHEEIDTMPHGIPRLHRPTAVKNLYEIFRDQRTTWPVAKREELLLDGEDEDSDENAEWEEDAEEVSGAEKEDSDEDAEGEDDEPVDMPRPEEADSGNETESSFVMCASHEGIVQEQESARSSPSSSSEVSQPKQGESSESEEDSEPFDYQSQYVIYNAQVDIVKAGDHCGDPSWTVNLSHFLSRPELECQQSPDRKWIDIKYLRFSYIEKALKKMKLLDEPGSSVWWSWLVREDIDWSSTKGQVRLNNGWDLGRAIWRSFEGHFEEFRGPRREIDGLPRDDDLPCFTLIIRKDAPNFGVPLGSVPELEGLFDEDKSDTETLLAKSDTKSDYMVTRLWKFITSSQTTTAEKRPRDEESDESQPSGKRRKMAAPWEL